MSFTAYVLSISLASSAYLILALSLLLSLTLSLPSSLALSLSCSLALSLSCSLALLLALYLSLYLILSLSSPLPLSISPIYIYIYIYCLASTAFIKTTLFLSLCVPPHNNLTHPFSLSNNLSSCPTPCRVHGDKREREEMNAELITRHQQR